MNAILRTQRVLWAAVLAATIVFAALLALGIRADGAVPTPVLGPALAGVALMVAVSSVMLPAYIHVTTAARLAVPTVLEPDPHAEVPIHLKEAPMRKVAAEPARARHDAARVFQTPFILSMALSEAVGLCGFVLGLLGFGLATAAPFFVVCWALILARFPNQERILSPVERALGLTIPRA